MKAEVKGNKFGGLRHVTAQDYVKEVTNAPEDIYCFVHLYQDYVPECTVLNRVLEELSNRHREVKFCAIKAHDANSEYPDKALPTLIVYKNKEVRLGIPTTLPAHNAAVPAGRLSWFGVGL